MTALLVSLGSAPGEGREAVDQCVRFKGFMRNLIGRDPAGAYIKTLSEDGKRGLAVEYEPGVVGAREWAESAEELAGQVWEMVTRAEKVRVR